MLDKKEIRQEIVNYLCGEEGLKDEFIDLLKSGGLSEDDGYEIKEKLLNEIDSSKDLNLVFVTSFDRDFPSDKLEEYTNNESYLELVEAQYPQSVEEAVDILIVGLDTEDINIIRESSKDEFGPSAHFGLALYVRNHFGLNNSKAKNLISDIYKKGGFECMLFADSLSGFLMDELWERVQKEYEEALLDDSEFFDKLRKIMQKHDEEMMEMYLDSYEEYLKEMNDEELNEDYRQYLKENNINRKWDK